MTAISNRPVIAAWCPPDGLKPRREPVDVTYTCPMRPEVESSRPARCPECGMDLQPKQEG